MATVVFGGSCGGSVGGIYGGCGMGGGFLVGGWVYAVV